MHPALEHGLIGSFRLFPLPRRLHLRGYSSALFTALVLLPVHTVQPIFLTVSFPTSSFCSISQCDLPSMVPPCTLPAPPSPNCVYAACVLFVSSTCHSETHCFVYGPASHTPNHSRTADCRRDAAAEDHTRLSKGLPAGPSPAAEANAAYFHCTLVRFLHIYFSTCVYYLI